MVMYITTARIRQNKTGKQKIAVCSVWGRVTELFRIETEASMKIDIWEMSLKNI